MKIRHMVVLSITFALLVLVLPLNSVQAQNYIQYKVQVNSDGSSAWSIIQVSETNGTVDTFVGFQQRVASLIDAASNLTQREMSLDQNSPQISTTISSNQSKTTEYLFSWVNFSAAQNGSLTFGDIFGVSGFFNQLYGDGALLITYPSTYDVQSVSPAPDERVDSAQTLQWLGTQFFANSSPHIVLSSISSSTSSPTPNPNANGLDWQLFLLIGVGAAAVAASLASFAILRRRRRKAVNLAEKNAFSDSMAIESEEQKIVKILQVNGGTMLQNAITDQSKFSKAKASQLLSALEKKGIVRRYKKGRDKIVILNAQGKGE